MIYGHFSGSMCCFFLSNDKSNPRFWCGTNVFHDIICNQNANLRSTDFQWNLRQQISTIFTAHSAMNFKWVILAMAPSTPLCSLHSLIIQLMLLFTCESNSISVMALLLFRFLIRTTNEKPTILIVHFN